MKVNVAVCGMFHFHKHIGYYSRSGLLGAFYCSHRLSTNAASLGVQQGVVCNCFAKEYLLRGAMQVFPGNLGLTLFGRLSHSLWETQVLSAWQPCDILHVMLHGTSRRLLKRARREGALIIGEPVMSHPAVLRRLMDEEHRMLGLPRPSTIHGADSRVYEESNLCNHLIVGSRIVRDSYVAEGFPSNAVTVIPYALDPVRFTPLSAAEKHAADDGRFRVIYVGQITPRKGTHYLLEAWKQLAFPHTRAELLLVGTIDPCMRPVLDRYSGLFTHIQAVPHQQLRAHYGRSTVFVLPSVEDGFGLVTAEAMACGLPVIVSAAAGSADLVVDGQNGYVVEPRSAQAIRDKLELLYHDRNHAAKLGLRTNELLAKQTTWELYAARFADEHRRLAACRGQS